ncbi:GTP cyclohydrolase I [Pontimonas salivibrio]|uniref:GTP cyclohydrolase 1 n=1 Tax=Pontimonas salivibrio TaxID=1159327 RepID=A0A2L2BN11_9MICO|nr:GTP cyclohydrolase I FolE [Pontimonas salivibrio]AVG23055.1 GTP cyclohydrolase I [Pontimonas salivibrio]
MDDQRLQDAVTELLEALGENPERDGLQGTPGRVSKLFQELYRGVGIDPVTVLEEARPLAEAEDQFGDFVALRGIAFSSICEHHLLPFRGTADVGYQPADKLVGLGILADVVEIAASRPQMQERLGDMVADALVRSGVAAGSVVVLRGEHGCVQHRGPKLSESETVTVATAGSFRDPAARREALLSMGSAPLADADPTLPHGSN